VVDIDKYVQYVIAQIGEAAHTFEDIKEDLKERGLSDSDISDIMDIANREGCIIESVHDELMIVRFIKLSILPCLIIIMYIINGENILNSSFFWILFFASIRLVWVLFRKRKFPKKIFFRTINE